jgi:hypothetical protein
VPAARKASSTARSGSNRGTFFVVRKNKLAPEEKGVYFSVYLYSSIPKEYSVTKSIGGKNRRKWITGEDTGPGAAAYDIRG